MATNIIITTLFIISFVGWALLLYFIFQTFQSRRREVELIKQIKIELDLVKKDLEQAKKSH